MSIIGDLFLGQKGGLNKLYGDMRRVNRLGLTTRRSFGRGQMQRSAGVRRSTASYSTTVDLQKFVHSVRRNRRRTEDIRDELGDEGWLQSVGSDGVWCHGIAIFSRRTSALELEADGAAFERAR